MKRTIETAYWPGDVVYHRAEKEERTGIVTLVTIRKDGSVSYLVKFGYSMEVACDPCELTSVFVPDYVTKEDNAE